MLGKLEDFGKPKLWPGNMSYSLNSCKGGTQEIVQKTIIGISKGTLGTDYSSYQYPLV